jgi:membrane protein
VVDDDRVGRLEAWAAERSGRVAGHNPWLLGIRSTRRFVDVRVTGLAAEMTYYALLSLIPLLIALGAGLGLLERILGSAQVRRIEDTVVRALEGVFSPDVTDEVMAPLVRGLLQEERTGLAVGSLLITFWLASRAFRATIRALDDAYEVQDRRSMVTQWGLAYAFALGAIAVVSLVLSMFVVGPLLGGGRQIAEWFGIGPALEIVWSIGRWPVVLLIACAYLLWLYRVGPNVDNTWRDCVPGALFGGLGTVLVAVGFRMYLEVAGPQAPAVGDAQESVQVAAQTIGAVLATVLLVWLTSIVVLTGAILNAEIDRHPSRPARLPDEPA